MLDLSSANDTRVHRPRNERRRLEFRTAQGRKKRRKQERKVETKPLDLSFVPRHGILFLLLVSVPIGLPGEQRVHGNKVQATSTIAREYHSLRESITSDISG